MRTIKTVLAGTALISVAVLGSSTGPAQAGAAAATKCTPTWNLVTLPAHGPNAEARSVTALSAQDVRITGQFSADVSFMFEPWALRGDGRSVTATTSPPRIPGSDFFFGTSAIFTGGQGASFSSDDEGWALAATTGITSIENRPQAVAEHWHGGRWTMVPWAVPSDPTATTLVPMGVAAVSANDAWAVAALFSTTTQVGLKPLGAVIEHWDGNDWSLVPNPASDKPFTLFKAIDARSATDIWAVGQQIDDREGIIPLVEHFDGTAWRVIPAPANSEAAILNAVSATGPDDVWAVGDHDETGSPLPLVEHFDGTTWKVVTTLPDTGTLELDSVYAADPNNVWAIGGGSQTVLHWDGKAWTASKLPGPPELGLEYRYTAVDGTGPNDVWAVGKVTNHAMGLDVITPQVAHLSCGRS